MSDRTTLITVWANARREVFVRLHEELTELEGHQQMEICRGVSSEMWEAIREVELNLRRSERVATRIIGNMRGDGETNER